MIQKPFLKWVGGKTQIIQTVMNKFPKEMNNYHEPFLGGGSVLLALLSFKKEGKIVVKDKIYAYDLNESLIDTFNNVKNNSKELFEFVTKYMKEYDSIKSIIVNRQALTIEEAMTSKESYYYWLRNKYNKMKLSIEKSALFMILNKLCFRGMHREGPNGYNVPFGHYKTTPTIISEHDMTYISLLIQDVEFKCCNWKESLLNTKKDDFIYMDPPYAPLNSKSFVGYTSDGFTIEDHKQLFDKIISLDANFLMSNSKVELVMIYFKDYTYEEIVARRAINSKNPGSTAVEILVHN